LTASVLEGSHGSLEGPSRCLAVTVTTLGRIEPAVLIHNAHTFLVLGIQVDVLDTLGHDHGPPMFGAGTPRGLVLC